MAQLTAAAPGAESGHGTQEKHFWALALGSIGVVYGDIGTSPLYALKEAVKAATPHRERPARKRCLASCRW